LKILIVSDLHANLEALAAVREGYDELWILGDLVNYGPNPAEVIEFVSSSEVFDLKPTSVAPGNSVESRSCRVYRNC